MTGGSGRAAGGWRAVLFFTALFAAIHAAIRLIPGDSLAMDDAKTAVFAQVWQWGYLPDNPPLFEWIVRLLSEVMGHGIGTFFAIKYACLVAAALFVYGIAARYVGRHVAAGTALGMVLLYQIGWNFHQAFTHSALLLPLCGAVMFAGFRLLSRPGPNRAATFGVAVGLALLAKYNAAFLVAPFCLAAIMLPGYRRNALRPVNLVAVAVAALIVAPHAVWFLTENATFAPTLEAALGTEGDRGARLAAGIGDYAVGAVSFFLPFGLLVPFLWKGRARGLLPEERLLFLASALSALLLLGMVVFVGIGAISERYFIPVLLPAYIAAATVLLRARATLTLWWLAVAFTAIATVAIRLLIYSVPGEPFCGMCQEFVPFETLEEAVAETVPEGSILIVREEDTGGNMVAMFPGSPVRVFTSLHLINPIREEHAARPCFLVWSEDLVGGVPLEYVVRFAYDDPDTVYVDAPWQHFRREAGWRATRWGITPLDSPSVYDYFCLPSD